MMVNVINQSERIKGFTTLLLHRLHSKKVKFESTLVNFLVYPVTFDKWMIPKYQRPKLQFQARDTRLNIDVILIA